MQQSDDSHKYSHVTLYLLIFFFVHVKDVACSTDLVGEVCVFHQQLMYTAGLLHARSSKRIAVETRVAL